MVKKIMLAMLLVISVHAKEILKQDFNVRNVVSVYDGDTFRVNLLCNEPLMCKDVPIRVLGIDAPEIRGGSGTEAEKRKAKIAQEYAYKFLKNSRINLKNCVRDRFFGLACEVKNISNEDLAEFLIETGYAVPYDGKEKNKDWSEEYDGL